MGYRKSTLFTACIFFALLLSAKFLFFGIVGIGAKGLLFFGQGATFSYDFIDWKNHQMVFHHPFIQKKGKYRCEAQAITLDFSLKHWIMDHPQIMIESLVDPIDKSSHWTVEIKEGELCLPGLESFTFSFERNWDHQIGRLVVQKEAAYLEVEALSENEKIKVQTTCRQMNVAWISILLDHFYPNISSITDYIKKMRGIIDGSCHVSWDGSRLERGSARLMLEKGGYHNNIDEVSGIIDFEGPLSWNLLNDGFLKVELEQGLIASKEYSVKSLVGELWLTGGIGAKWSLKGLDEINEESLAIDGRAILSKERWFESTIQWMHGMVQVHGEEKNQEYEIKATAKDLGPLFLSDHVQLLCENLQGHFCSKTQEMRLDLSNVSVREEDHFLLEQGTFSLVGKWIDRRWWVDYIEGISPVISFHGKGWLDPTLQFECQLNSMRLSNDLMVSLCHLPSLPPGEFLIEEEGFDARGSLFSPEWSMRAAQQLYWHEQPLDFWVLAAIEKNTDQMLFDVRLDGTFIEKARVSGSYVQGHCVFDEAVSHIMGKTFKIKEDHHQLVCALEIPGSIIGSKDPVPCDCAFSFQNSSCDVSFISPLLDFQGTIGWEALDWYCANGRFRYGTIIDGYFQAKGKGIEEFDCQIDQAHITYFNQVPISTDFSGTLSKQGSSFDLDACLHQLIINDLHFESLDTLHMKYEPEKGIFLSGINLQIDKSIYKIGWLTIDAAFDHCSLYDADIHMDPYFLNGDIHLSRNLLEMKAELNLKKGIFSYLGDSYSILDGTFVFDQRGGDGSFFYLHHDEKLPMSLHYWMTDWWQGTYDNLKARGELTIHDIDPESNKALTFDWNYDHSFEVNAIHGGITGLDIYLYQNELKNLIGSISFDCHAIRSFVPVSIQQLFQDLKMGKGYVLKGEIIPQNQWYFSGILTGKNIELFGYQFRALFADIKVQPDLCLIQHLHVQDLAGEMQIEELKAYALNDAPWMIEIPSLKVLELRPAFLHKPGEALGKESPLVIRKMELNQFQGELEKSETYTGHGTLSFINSYRREHTVFDIPSDILSRIFGLDLELLIPVRGSIHYELKDRFFRVLELQQIYSAAERSLFFLAPALTVQGLDLDGNLYGLIQMKHFVLFPFTESFWISIKGTLEDPKFQLRRKDFDL